MNGHDRACKRTETGGEEEEALVLRLGDAIQELAEETFAPEGESGLTEACEAVTEAFLAGRVRLAFVPADDSTTLVVVVRVTAGELRSYAASVGVALPDQSVSGLTRALADQVLAGEREVHGLAAEVTHVAG